MDYSWIRPIRPIRRIPLLVMLAVAGCAVAAEVVNDAPRPSLDVPHAAVKPKMDGSPTDPAWDAAAKIPQFSVSVGDNTKGLAALPTEVRVLWDDANLYVRFICTDSEIYSPHTGRDASHYEGDVAEIFFDPKGDQRQYFELQVSPNNQVLDQNILVTCEPKFTPALTFDWAFVGKDVWYDLAYTLQGFTTATGRFEKDAKPAGWIADAAIPAKASLKRLGTDKFAAGMQMRINFIRYDWPVDTAAGGAEDGAGKRKLIAMNWAPVLFGCPHVSPAAMGSIKLMK